MTQLLCNKTSLLVRSLPVLTTLSCLLGSHVLIQLRCCLLLSSQLQLIGGFLKRNEEPDESFVGQLECPIFSLLNYTNFPIIVSTCFEWTMESLAIIEDFFPKLAVCDDFRSSITFA